MSNEKIIIMIFVIFLIFIISVSTYHHVYWEVVTLDDHTLFMMKSILVEYDILFFQYGRQNEIVIYSHHSFSTCLILYYLLGI